MPPAPASRSDVAPHSPGAPALPPQTGPEGRSASVFRLWWPVLALMAAIFVVSSIEQLPASPGGLSDKQAHALTYALLAGLTLRALAGGRWRGVWAGRALVAALVAILYGASDEWHQSFVPGRHAEASDLLADALGASAAAGTLWAWGIIRRFSRRARGACLS